MENTTQKLINIIETDSLYKFYESKMLNAIKNRDNKTANGYKNIMKDYLNDKIK